jgi:hypothetical protein
MVLNKTLNLFSIFSEVLIGFSTFAIFFAIFMIYYFTDHEVALLGNFIKTSTSYYVNDIISDNLKINKIINSSSKIKELKRNIEINEKEVDEHNAPYDRKLLYIIFGMIICLLLLLIIPVLLGIIKLEQINFKYIGISLLLHIIIIVGFEILFLVVIISYINPVKLYNVFLNNKAQTGNYI